MQYFKEKSRRAKIEFEMVLVQPGASVTTISDDILRLLGNNRVVPKQNHPSQVPSDYFSLSSLFRRRKKFVIAFGQRNLSSKSAPCVRSVIQLLELELRNFLFQRI